MGEQIGKRHFLGAADVTFEKTGKIAGRAGICRANDFFDGRFDCGAVGVKAPALRILLIHPEQDVVEAGAIIRGVANQNVEREAQQLALVVIGDAEITAVVERIFIEPGVQAGLFRALPGSRGARFELRDLRAEVGEKLRVVPDARAHQRVSCVGAGDAFGEPKRGRPHLARIVHRLERLRANTLHVPEVEKFVRADVGQRGKRTDGDGRTVGVLHSPATVIRSDVQ